jgi:hypothetical protein
MSSTLANYSSGVGTMDATLVGAPGLDTTTAAVGTADLSLNATQQQYLLSQTNVTTPTATVGNGISFSGWFYPSGTQAPGATIFDISGTGCAVSLYYGTSNTLYGYFNGAMVQSTVAVNPGRWHFFCYTIFCTTVTTALQSLYIDASLNVGGTYPATNTTANYVSFSVGSAAAGTGSYIGYGAGSGSGASPAYTYFNGKIDDFRFYNRVLSLPEINVLFQFNYKSGATPTIVSQMAYDLSYVNAVQIDVSGTFSGLYVTRTAQVGTVTTTTQSALSCANLVFVNATTWAYVDTTVTADTSYSYTLQPFVVNTAGPVVQFGSITTTPLFNGFFNQGGSLPIQGQMAAVTATNLPGWSVTGAGAYLANGPVTGVYTGALPSTLTYYLDVSQNTPGSVVLSQYVGIYQGTSGMVSFYAWPQDVSYATTQTLTVALGGIVLLNRYSFGATVTGAAPTAFSLPFSMSTAGTYLLTLTITQTATVRSGINLGGVQIRSAMAAGVGYQVVDPSGLALYYPFDLATVSGTVVYDCSAGFTGLPVTADASLCGGAQLDTTQTLTGTADVAFNGTSAYVQLGAWQMPTAVAGNGFTVSGWFNPSLVTEPSNATLCFFGSTACNLMVYLNQQNNWLDFSYNVVGGSEYVSNTYRLQTNGWNFFAMTASCTGSGVTAGTFTYYLNDVSMATQTGAWPQATALFTNNYLGGVPFNNPTVNSYGPLGYFAGYLDDFRVYNRALTAPDVMSLWTYGFASTQYTNVIDPMGLGVYYPFDQGGVLLRGPPTPIVGGTATGLTATGFTLGWTGGTGIGVTTTATVFNGATTLTFTGVTTPYGFTGLAAPTAANNYTYTVTLTATNMVGVTTGQVTVYPLPSVTGLWNGAVTNTLTLTVGNYTTVGSPVPTYTYSVTGTGSATALTGGVSAASTTTGALPGASPWTVTVTMAVGGQTLTGTATVYSSPFTITPNIVGWTAGQDVSGTSVYNGVTYSVYAFKPTLAAGAANKSYTLTYSCATASYIYVLAVGGGGGGGIFLGGGGGAGGVVMLPIYLQSSSNTTISISVGAGGTGATTANSGTNSNGQTGGYNTTVTFSPSSSSNIPNILASGGAPGGCNNLIASTTNGSGTAAGGGGNGYNTGSLNTTPANNNGYNFANGGASAAGSGSGGGGAGAGTIGANSTVNGPGVNGGNGIQCFLPGISTFAPSGTAYGTYYWAGGGGSAGNNSPAGGGGNGGLGGGGGGGGGTTAVPGGSGGAGINNGSSGNLSSSNAGGSGASNTGGGGGATYGANGSSFSGAGGSGIVILAFPQTAITTNAKAVLPLALYNSGRYNDVLSNDSFNGTKTTTLSTAAYNSAKGAFACKLVNYNYFGPVMTLRFSTDTNGFYTQNFYADVCGNLGTTYLGTGTSVAAWLTANGANTTYAYVTKWYNQAMDICFNSATQYTLANQPIYDVTSNIMNFNYAGATVPATTTSYGCLQLANYDYPSTGSVAVTFRRGAMSCVSGVNNCPILFSGTASGGGGQNLSGVTLMYSATIPNWALFYSNVAGNTAYFSSSTTTGTNTNNVISSFVDVSASTYGTLMIYTNGINVPSTNLVTTGVRSNTIAALSPVYIGYYTPGANLSAVGNFMKGQLYNLFLYNNNLKTGADQAIIENTPYTYTAPAAMTLTVASITTTSFTLTASAVTGAAYYAVYVGGAMYGTTLYTSLSATTFTPGTAGPWTVNVYAYNAGYGLLACGTMTTYLTTSITNLRFFFTFDALVGGYLPNLSPNAITNDKFSLNSPTVLTTSLYKFGTASATSGGFIRCSNAYTIPITGLSYSIWVYISSTMTFSTSPLFGFSSTPSTPLLYLTLTGSTGNTNLGWYVSGVSGAVTAAMTSNTWYHICWTISPAAYGGACTYTFYLNGNVLSTVSGSYPGNGSCGIQDILAYAGLSSASGFYIDNFRSYELTLTAANISTIYNYLDPNNLA